MGARRCEASLRDDERVSFLTLNEKRVLPKAGKQKGGGICPARRTAAGASDGKQRTRRFTEVPLRPGPRPERRLRWRPVGGRGRRERQPSRNERRERCGCARPRRRSEGGECSCRTGAIETNEKAGRYLDGFSGAGDATQNYRRGRAADARPSTAA